MRDWLFDLRVLEFDIKKRTKDSESKLTIDRLIFITKRELVERTTGEIARKSWETLGGFSPLKC